MNHWIISYRHFDINSVRLRETIFTLGNGYFATRGAHEDAASKTHYPGTYLGGVYNRSVSKIAGKELVNEDLVNLPNWLPITFKIENEDWLDINKVELLSYREFLDIKRGIVKRIIKFKDPKGRIFVINSLRFVSQHNKHLAGIRYVITSQNWQGKITIRSSIIGSTNNKGVPRYQELNTQHLEIIDKGIFSEECLFLQARTNTSHIELSQAVKTELFRGKNKFRDGYTIHEEEKDIHQSFDIEITPYEPITIHKTVALYYSRDHAIYENLYDAKKLITSTSFNELLKQHIRAWNHLWYQSDIEIDSINNEQLLIRLHIFHSLQSLSKHSKSIDYGVPARGLHGEAYRGHVFWDEIFILPFYFYHYPDIARSMLMYRYHRLDAARELAKESGYAGAMFPWQSASNGEEETQKFHLNPQSSTWGPDFSSQQRHVNLAILYNVWNYYQVTQDIDFIVEYGAEIIFEIAKFLSSITSFNRKRYKYEINGVMGPDEYHERYPNATAAGLNNNCYTNVMTVWALEKAIELTNILSQPQRDHLLESLAITTAEINQWKRITFNMYIPFHHHLLCQFEGYEQLEEFNWHYYKEKYPNYERLDRILKAEGVDPNRYKIAKQPDTLMLYYLLEEGEIKKILNQLGYSYSENTKNYNIGYYLKRTSHGSTLSKITFSALLLHYDATKAYELYQEALISDIEDTQGGTTQEGIHLGVMTATTSFLFKNLSGLTINRGILTFSPNLPNWISRLKFKLLFQKNWYELEINHQACYVTLIEQYQSNGRVIIHNQLVELALGETQCIPRRIKNIAAAC